MKKKFATKEDLEKISQFKQELTFGTQSFFQSIAPPPRTVAVIFQKDLRIAETRGTMVILRIDDDRPPFNIDEYSLYNPELVGPLKPEGYHWVADIPEHLKETMPAWVKDAIEKNE